MSFERATSSIRIFESLFIPGLLQVEGYARAIIPALLPALSDQEVARHVELRRERQALLRGPDAPMLDVVLDEAAIRRLASMPDVMENQLAHLTRAAQLPNVNLQVLPFTAATHEGLSGSLIILGFPHEADRDVIFIELPVAQLYLDGDEQLLRYTRLFKGLQAAALSAEESIAFIAAIGEGRPSQ